MYFLCGGVNFFPPLLEYYHPIVTLPESLGNGRGCAGCSDVQPLDGTISRGNLTPVPCLQ